MSRLTHADWLILWIYLIYVLGIGLIFKSSMKAAKDYLQAARVLPAWICGLALGGISLGAPEVIGLAGLGARYGFGAAQFFGIGAIPAMVFASVFLMPLYYGSTARTLPEFLRLRFDAKTRTLAALLFLALSVLSSGIALYTLARVIQGVHLLDRLLLSVGLRESGIFACVVALGSLFVLVYTLLGGLTSSIYNQVSQFLLTVAGLFPMVLLGLKSEGGWAGLKASISAAHMHEWSGNPLGMGMAAVLIGLGVVFGGAYWCANFSTIQTTMAARDTNSAERAGLIAAIPRMFFPVLVVLPGVMALGLATPHSVTTVMTNPDGSIVHTIQVVPQEQAEGKGVVPARVDTATGKPVLDSSGQPLLDYDMALPNMLTHFLPTGLLGLGLAALLAAFMAGMSANVIAFSAVFACDLYEPSIRKGADVAVSRWAVVGAVLLSVAAAFAALGFDSIIETLVLVFSILGAPMLAVVLLGAFWKRTTGHGAFAGLVIGTLAALLHHGLTLASGARPGLHGGWISVVHRFPNMLAQNLWDGIAGFAAGALVAALVSLLTDPRPDSELTGLVYWLMPKRPAVRGSWWQRPQALGIAVLVAAVVLNILFA